MTRLIPALIAALLLAMPASAQGTRADLAKTGGYTIIIDKGGPNERTVYCTGTAEEQSACFTSNSRLANGKPRSITGVPASNFAPDIASNYRGNTGVQERSAAASDVDITQPTPGIPLVRNPDGTIGRLPTISGTGVNPRATLAPGTGQRPGVTVLQPPSGGGTTYGDRHRAQADAFRDRQIYGSYGISPHPGQPSLQGLSPADQHRLLADQWQQQMLRNYGHSTGRKDK